MSGALRSRDSEETMSASQAIPDDHEGAPPAFHLLAKPTGAVCNLDCSYCFFLSKEMLYPGSRFRMADELLETYLRQLIEAHSRVPEVAIAWQGGEPTLMGVEFFRLPEAYCHCPFCHHEFAVGAVAQPRAETPVRER